MNAIDAVVERPVDEAEVAHLVAQAFVTKTALEVRGGGSKSRIGRPVEARAVVETGKLTGLTLYEPAELVIAARAGTPLSELVAALEAKGQMLPFEPADYRRLLGSGGSEPTVGGMVATNLSGPRRIAAGACRDALIGVRFVNGRGDIVKSGGRVMKNVTGYDLCKLLAGSWGTLGIITEATLKVVPKPETSVSLAWSGLNEEEAVALMSAALGSPYEVSAASHSPERDGTAAVTLLRLENFARSTSYRAGELSRTLQRFGAPQILEAEASASAFAAIRDVLPLIDRPGAVWRVSVAPSRAPAVARALRQAGEVTLLYDWGGGLMWIAIEEESEAVRRVREAAHAEGGHATLIRASEALRRTVAPFAAQSGPLSALTRRVKAAFDPAGLLNPGRMGE
jgi:glycolate oxidase FAD binding subunit